MNILAIETSCDDTSCAVVRDGQVVLSCEVVSQEEVHASTGGVVPEVAAREHIKKIIPTIEKALSVAQCAWNDIDAIAVTHEPGLLGSLLIGRVTADVLASLYKKPLVKVHHIEGHLSAPWLIPQEAATAGEAKPTLTYPLIALTVSGGHNDIIYMDSPTKYRVLGSSLDDAAGEAFDKVARLLELGFPGGPAISKAALDGRDTLNLTRPLLNDGTLNFSFSGLKSAMRRIVEKELEEQGELSNAFIANASCSFQECVVDVLVSKAMSAVEQFPEVTGVMMTGGVSANSLLRERITEAAHGKGLAVFIPYKPLYSTDNAAMIGARAYFDLI